MNGPLPSYVSPPPSPGPQHAAIRADGLGHPNRPNTAHPLYGMSTADRIESRQRTLAKALAEVLRTKRAASGSPS